MSSHPDSVHNRSTDSASLGPEAPERLWPALRLLLAVHVRAQTTGREPWDIALGLPELEAAGLTHDDLRKLIARRLLAHKVAKPGRGGRRTLVRPSGSELSPRSHFLLTAAGVRWAERLLASDAARTAATTPAEGESRPLPVWDAESGLLHYTGRLVLELSAQASVRKLILDAFQEDGWKLRIDNSVKPRSAGDDTGKRLRDALSGLNRSQLWPALWFEAHGDGARWWRFKEWQQIQRRRGRRRQ